DRHTVGGLVGLGYLFSVVIRLGKLHPGKPPPKQREHRQANNQQHRQPPSARLFAAPRAGGIPARHRHTAFRSTKFTKTILLYASLRQKAMPGRASAFHPAGTKQKVPGAAVSVSGARSFRPVSSG